MYPRDSEDPSSVLEGGGAGEAAQAEQTSRVMQPSSTWRQQNRGGRSGATHVLQVSKRVPRHCIGRWIAFCLSLTPRDSPRRSWLEDRTAKRGKRERGRVAGRSLHSPATTRETRRCDGTEESGGKEAAAAINQTRETRHQTWICWTETTRNSCCD